MNDTRAVKYEQEIADIVQGLVGAQGVVDAQAFDRKLNHLVKLRASQINGCAHCIKMHTKEARQDGETNERLDRVIVWEHVHDFSEKEKAALALISQIMTIVGGLTRPAKSIFRVEACARGGG
jgi:AhpD family alkylhydroperoxidase